MEPRVFLVDDQASVLKALSRLLNSAGYDVVSYDSAQSFLNSGNVNAPGCLVLDLSMPDMNGLALQQALAQCASTLPVIFLTGRGDISISVQAMKAGAIDFLTKPVDDKCLIDAISLAFERNRHALMDREHCEDILTRLASLTPREREVLFFLAEGRLNKQIAAELGTVEKTIKVHRARIMSKMKVRSLTALVRLVDRVNVTSLTSNSS